MPETTLSADLKAARTLAGLKQDEAAALMKVHRGTFNGWERGWRPLPSVKFYKFLSTVGLTRQDLDEYFARQPVKLVYDADGYPAPYTKARHLEDLDGVAEALEKLEGTEYPMRARERERIRVIPIYGDNVDGLNRYMARYDAEQGELA